MENYTLVTEHKECCWQSKASLNFKEIMSQGLCIGANTQTAMGIMYPFQHPKDISILTMKLGGHAPLD